MKRCAFHVATWHCTIVVMACMLLKRGRGYPNAGVGDVPEVERRLEEAVHAGLEHEVVH